MALLNPLTNETYNALANDVIRGYVLVDYRDVLLQSAESISKYVDPVWTPPEALKPYFDELPFTLEFSKQALPQLYNVCTKSSITDDQFVGLVSNTMKDIVARRVLPGKRLFTTSPIAGEVLDGLFSVGALSDKSFIKTVFDFATDFAKNTTGDKKRILSDWIVSTFADDWFQKNYNWLALAAYNGGITPSTFHEVFHYWIWMMLPKIGSGELGDPLRLVA